MKIRKASNDDYQELLLLIVDTIESSCKNDYNHEQIEAWISSAKKIEHWDNLFNEQFALVAEINNKAVGFGSLQNGNFIYFMYVHKDYLGLGIASSIFEELGKESKKLGFKQLSANVSKTALPFFKTKGFKIIKENNNVINEVTIINYHMINNQLEGQQ